MLNVSEASFDRTGSDWGQIGVTVAGRHVFDLTDSVVYSAGRSTVST
ncbi:hypothetical protein [Agromyces sp. NPDC058064]